jgi:hypothetical protein
MGRVADWLHDHSFHHEDPDKFEITPKTMWESVLLVILVINIILIALVLLFPDLAF